MSLREEPVEKKVILANGYTRGQINTLIQAEDNYQFYRVLDWFKTGLDDRLDGTNLTRLLKLQVASTVQPLWYPQALPTPVPDTLKLKGIAQSSKGRFALINDCTLEKYQEGKVRIGKTNLIIRCLEISDRSVVIQARGSEEKIALTLRAGD
jgi:hypothetical protein